MPTNTKVSAGFRSASRVVSESGRDGSATTIVAAVELLAVSKAYAPGTHAATAIKIAILFISTPIVNILIKPSNADRGHHAVAHARFRFDFAWAPHRDALQDRKAIGRADKIRLRCHRSNEGGTSAPRRGIFFDAQRGCPHASIERAAVA